MKDEIEEIIEALKNTIKDDRIPYEIEDYECKILLDYIINLQEALKDLTQYACDLEDQICYRNEEITNLQEENKKQEELISRLYSVISDDEENLKLLQEENEELKDYLKIMEKGKDNNLNRFLDYKSRNEKAIEYILKLDKEYDINVYQEDKHWAMVLYILQGDDKEC